MANERVIQATLKFGVDKGSVNRAQAEVKGVGASLKEIDNSGRQADKTLQKLKDDFQALKDRAQRLAEAQAGPKALAEALEKVKKEAQAVIEASNQMKEKADRLEGIGTRIAGVGAAISGPFILAATTYVQKAGQSEEISRKWLATTERMSEAQMRIGRVAAEAILPTLEKVANLAETAAAFAEKHPNIVAAALTIGTATATVGAIGIAVAQGIKLVADVKYLLASTQMNVAADKMLAAAGAMGKGGFLGKLLPAGALGVAGSVVAGVGAGALGYEGLRRAGYAQAGSASLGQFASVGAYGVGKLFGQDTANSWFKTVAEWTGEIASDAPKASNSIKKLSDEIKQVGQTAQAQGSAMDNLADKIQNVNRTVGQVGSSVSLPQGGEKLGSLSKMKQYKKKLQEQEQQQLNEEKQAALKQAQEEALAQAQADMQAQAERLKRIKDFNLQLRREEQDHQREMRRLQQDHRLRLEDAERSRDAATFLREQRDYQLQRKRAIEDYSLSRQREKQDFAGEMMASFAMQQNHQNFTYAPQYNFAERDDSGFILSQVDNHFNTKFKKLIGSNKKLKVH